VLIARLIPIISFDVVSYAAGFTRIGLLPFLVATGVGQLPATVVYSVLGENITSGSKVGLWALGALLSLLVLGITFKSRLDRRLHNGDLSSAALAADAGKTGDRGFPPPAPGRAPAAAPSQTLSK
ncbi:MAG: TVP38/TMEM64 family protein, partial [Chloroflexota bacterium]